MHRDESGTDRARVLQEATYAQLERSFRDCPVPMYGLRVPWLSPCALGESQTVNDRLQSVTLIYGSWDIRRPHVRVMTWRDLSGDDFVAEVAEVAEVPAGLVTAPAEETVVRLDGVPVAAALTRHPTAPTWLLRVDAAPLHLLVTGRGPIGDLAFASVQDLDEAVTARRAYLASR